MLDADAEEVLIFVDHVIKDGIDIGGANVSTAQSSCSVVDGWNLIDPLVPHLAIQCVTESSLDFSRQVVAGRRERIIHSLDN